MNRRPMLRGTTLATFILQHELNLVMRGVRAVFFASALVVSSKDGFFSQDRKASDSPACSYLLDPKNPPDKLHVRLSSCLGLPRKKFKRRIMVQPLLSTLFAASYLAS